MNSELRTVEAQELLGEMKPMARASLVAINEHRFSDGQDALLNLRALVDSAKSNVAADSDEYLNDVWVIRHRFPCEICVPLEQYSRSAVFGVVVSITGFARSSTVDQKVLPH